MPVHKVNPTETASHPDNAPSGASLAEPTRAGSSPRAATIKRSFFSLLCLFHMGAVIVFNLPQHTALGDLRAPFAWYARLSWLHQEWAMFTTIPHYAELEPVLVAKYKGGEERLFGPMLPGLRPYPADLRSLYLILHTVWASGEYRPLASGYLQHACDAITRQLGQRPSSVQLRVDAQVLAPLKQVRASHKVGRPERQASKAVKCR
jgi:hypothetical protein